MPARSTKSGKSTKSASSNLIFSYNDEIETEIGCSCADCQDTFSQGYEDNKRLIDTIKFLKNNSQQINATAECGCSMCEDSFNALIQDNQHLQGEVKVHSQHDPQVAKFYETGSSELAVRRLPALSVTMVLEICGGIVIKQFAEVIQSLTLIVSFMPAISALSGNLGLQANSNTVRGLGTGYITKKNYCSNIKKEVLSGLISATLVAIILSLIGLTWAYIEKVDAEAHSQVEDNLDSLEKICANITLSSSEESGTGKPPETTTIIPDYPKIPQYDDEILKQGQVYSISAKQLCKGIILHAREEMNKGKRKDLRGKMNPWLFGGIVFIGTWVSMMISTVNGASCPILAHMIGVDPAKVSGPLETAFQDIVGQSFLLALAYLAFHCIQPII